jgi:benzoyl-CoA reductase subunit C
MQTADKTSSGLAMVEEIYKNPGQRAKQLKKQGTKVIGHYCCLFPAEIVTAAKLLPYRIRGDVHEPITKADNYLDTIICPYLRSSFDLAVKGRYDFIDGVVVPSSCSNSRRFQIFWKDNVKSISYARYLKVPHTIKPASFNFFEGELADFKENLEELTKSKISDQRLNEAIELHNENRALLRELCQLRKSDPPLLSGTEMLETVVAGMSIPTDEANSLLKNVINDVTTRQNSREKRVRLLICGSVIDNSDFIQLVEDSGANVVVEDICFGTRAYWHDVEMSENPLASLARYYLEKIMCPRTYRVTEEERFGHIKRLSKDFQVDGVIIYSVRFCDSVQLEIPKLSEYLQQAGLPSLHIESDYTLSGLGALKTRIQAFTEMIQ